jgi:DNA repair exonuclease SbcCD nuclease subunit
MHNWTQFASADDEGRNTRLSIILDSLLEAVDTALEEGIDEMYLAGDLFHTRGSLPPSVLNRVVDCFGKITKRGMTVHAIPGNHDLESDNSCELTNASQVLTTVGVNVYTDTKQIGDIVMVPWKSSLDALRGELQTIADLSEDVSELVVFIHAPLNGVIEGIPDHGLSSTELEAFGFKALFSGHYHNFKEVGNKVWSIGALTHQTWGDIGSQAGYVIYNTETNEVEQRETSAPKFIDVSAIATMDADDLQKHVEGNYARLRLAQAEKKEVIECRDYLMELGAVGVIVNHTPAKTVSRQSNANTTNQQLSLKQQTGSWIEGNTPDSLKAAVMAESEDILSTIGGEA